MLGLKCLCSFARRRIGCFINTQNARFSAHLEESENFCMYPTCTKRTVPGAVPELRMRFGFRQCRRVGCSTIDHQVQMWFTSFALNNDCPGGPDAVLFQLSPFWIIRALQYWRSLGGWVQVLPRHGRTWVWWTQPCGPTRIGRDMGRMAWWTTQFYLFVPTILQCTGIPTGEWVGWGYLNSRWVYRWECMVLDMGVWQCSANFARKDTSS